VTLSGSNFVSGATVSFGGTAASNVTVTSSTTIMATTPAQPAGAVNVTVTNPDGQSATLNNSFTYTSLPAPTINKISPASGRITGGTSVMIKGSGFVKGATVLFGDVKAMTVTVSGSNAISAVSPPHASGAVNIVVINPDGQSSTLVRGFTYTVGKTAN
jgi:hypothetical protein